MLTARATAALAEAGVVLVDPDVSAAVQDAVREAHPGTELSPAVGEPAEVAKAAVAAAKNGAVVVRLVAGDPYTSDAVVKEVLAVGRTSVPFDVVPGVADGDRRPRLRGRGARQHRGDRRPAQRRRPGRAGRRGRRPAARWSCRAPPRSCPTRPPGWSRAGCPAAPRSSSPPAARGRRRRASSPSSSPSPRRPPGLDAFTGPVVATVGTAVDKRARLSWWESRPLFGWRVLVPRTKDQAGEMSERLRAYGAVPVEVPTIAVEPPRSPAQMDRAIKGLVTGRYGWIVFTSVNAVKAVREKFTELGLDARAPSPA